MDGKSPELPSSGIDQILRLFAKHTPAAVAMFDKEMRYLMVSDRWIEDYRLKGQQILGRSHYEIFSTLPERWKETHRRCLAGAVEKCPEDSFLREDGTIDWVQWEIHPWHEASGEIGGLIMFTEVITERKAREEQIRRLKRLYAVLSQINQTIVRNVSREELLRQTCRIAIDFGRFKLAWIGQLDPTTQALIPVASAGDDAGYLKKISVYADDRPEGRGPGGTSIREGKPSVMNDMSHDPRTQPWREAADASGLRSVASFPIRQGGQIIGAFLVYAGESDYFQTAEINLMEEVATDISFALDQMESQAKRREVEAELARNQAMLHSLTESTSDVIFVKDLQGRYVMINQSGLAAMGKSREEVIGKDDSALFPADQADRIVASERRAIKAGRPITFEEYLPKEGTPRTFLSTKGPLYNPEHSEVIGVFAIARDISARKQADEAREQRLLTLTSPTGDISDLRFEDLFNLEEIQKIQDSFAEATGVASVITDTNGRPLTRPSNFCRLCNEVIRKTEKGLANCYRSDACLGRMNACGPIIQPCLSGGLFDGGASICAGEQHIANWLVGQVLVEDEANTEHMIKYAREIGADETAFREALNAVPRMPKERFEKICRSLFLIAGQLSHLAMQNLQQARYITERKRTEKRLKQAKEAAEAADQAKDQFIAVLSHELRTPLTPVLASVSALQNQVDLPQKFHADMAMIHRNVHLEAKLIDDLLDVTRISRGKIELMREPVDAHACLQAAMEICQGEIDSKQLKVSCTLSAPNHVVFADSARLQQVFWNLIKNAVKFTPEGGRISLNSSNHGHVLQITIEDTGVGIEAEALPRIFEAFEQGEQTKARRFGGLGLGLSIARAVVDLHGGQLSAHSEGKDKGATFSLELALISPVSKPKEAPGLADSGSRHLSTILLVDDHADTLEILCRLLRKWGYTVVTATSVRTAMDAMASGKIDLLISDLGLPDGTGLDIMQSAKQRLGINGIALSGYGSDEDLRQSRAAGFSEHLVKPISFETLHKIVGRLLAE